jgi:predicted TIM-barrel fold metal-dependent hydrolase
VIWDGPIIDFHTHLLSESSGLRERDGSRSCLLEAADRYGLERLVVMPLFGGMHPSREEIEAGNDAAAAFGRQDARVAPFVTVYPPHQQDALAEVQRRIGGEGFAGLKVWCSLANGPFMDDLMEYMTSVNKPTLIHALHKSLDAAAVTGGQYPLESRPAHIAELARRHPRARIVMAHAGGNFLWSCDLIRDCPNVWTDISGTYCETGMVEHAVDTLGEHRVLFGTDLPGASFATNLAKVVAADASAGVKSRLLYHNARELLA